MERKTTLHIVTRTFLPSDGGLESWTWRLAHVLKSPSREVVVHIGGNSHPEAFYRVSVNERLQIRIVSRQRALLEEPLINSDWSLPSINLERARFGHFVPA